MASIGVFSDSEGNLQAFDAALQLLAKKGARRFFFAGGRYADLDEWVKAKRDEARSATDYTDGNFLQDVSGWLLGLEQADRPAAFGTAYEVQRRAEELARLKDRVVRTPEKGSLAYQDPAVPKKAMDMLGDALCCVVHDKNDFDKEDMLNAAVLFHGRAPEPAVVQIGPRYFVTPGRLKGGKVATVGLIDLDGKGLRFSAFSLDGKTLIDGQALALGGGKSKIAVK